MRLCFQIIVVCCSLAAGAFGPAFGANNNYGWTAIGPDGGDVFAMAGNGKGVLYAGTRSGVFLSRDWGQHWMRSGLGSQVVHSLALDNLENAIAAAGGGLYRKVANTQEWQPVAAPGFYYCLAVDTRGTFYAGSLRSGVVSSSDYGATWTSRPLAISSPAVTTIAVGESGTLYAGTRHRVYISKDHGETWADHPLPEQGDEITSLTVGASRDTGAAAETLNVGCENGQVYSSADGGATWTSPSQVTFSSPVNGLQAAPDGALYASNDHGLWSLDTYLGAWRPQGGRYGGPSIHGFLQLAGRFLLETSSGVFTAGTDGFLPLNHGLRAQEINVLRVGPSGLLLAATSEGVYRSLDSGASWSLSGLVGNRVTTIAIAPDGTLLAAGASESNIPSIFRSRDNGQTWQAAGPFPPGAAINALAAGKDHVVYAATSLGMFRSADDGDHWSGINRGMEEQNIHSLIVLPDGAVIAGSRSGVFRSSDGGNHWTGATDGLTGRHVETLAIGPASVLYAASGANLYRSNDRGSAWEARGTLPQGSQGPLQLVVGGDGALFAADRQTGVWLSSDGGATWKSMSQGIEDQSVTTLALSSTGQLLAGAAGGSVWELDAQNTAVAALNVKH